MRAVTCWAIALLSLWASACGLELAGWDKGSTRHVQEKAQASKSCPDGCLQRGNCNHEEGRCECPYTLKGPACEEQTVPTCNFGNSSEIGCPESATFLSSCECFVQCGYAEFKDGLYTSTAFAHFPSYCFKRLDLPREQQSSRFPEDNEKAEFYASEGPMFQFSAVPRMKFGDYLPLSVCPDKCNFRGWCRQANDPQQTREPYCMCLSRYHGRSCELLREDWPGVVELCYNNCNGRGTCIGGFCHCAPGFFGIDCGRSQVFGPEPVRLPVRAVPRVYVYELPHGLNRNPELQLMNIYSAHLHFTKTLLVDWSVRTEDPWEANLFFIPLFNIRYGGNVGWVLDPGAAKHMQGIIAHIRSKFSFWDRNEGRDHFWFVTNDMGVCYYPKDVPDLQRPMKVVHMAWYKNPTNQGFTDFGQDVMDCYNPVKDVAAPPLFPHRLDNMPAASWLHSTEPLEHFVSRKRIVLYFEGALEFHPIREYSFGVRADLNKVLGSMTDADIIFRGMANHNYSALSEARFCIDPPGLGWSMRAVTSIFAGCIPVFIQDHMFPPLHDALPWHRMSLRLRRADIPNIVEIVRAVTDEQLVAMLLVARRHHRALWWEAPPLGRAYNLTIHTLHARLQNMWSVHW